MEQEKDITKLQLAAISRPSLLQSATQENNRLADYIPRFSEPQADARQDQSPTLRRRRMKCNCNAKYAKSFYSKAFSTSHYGQLFGHRWLLQSGTHSVGSHHRACPMYSSAPAFATARFSIGICGAILNRAVEASISMTRGAGGFSISPKLHCARVVSYGCKAFNLVNLYEDEITPISNFGDWEGFLRGRTQELERLFREGQATSYDVDLQGKTLLHVRG